MDIEQKAKAYDKAIERAKELLEIGLKDTRDKKVVLSFFPELHESEEEKIRKVLIDYFNRYKEQEECGINTFYGIPTVNILAWLEKQKSEEINVKALLTADRLAAAEMTGRLKERKDIVENPQKYGLEKQGKKEKSLHPQSHWKPSQEQMYMLEWLTTNVLDDGVVGNKAKEVLYTLIEQLKSL